MSGSLSGIAVDGGGTRTRVRLVDAGGATLAEAVGGPANLTFGVARAWAAIEAALASAGVVLREAADVPLVAAMAGSREPELRQAFVAARPGTGPVRVVSDGYAAHVGAFAGAAGTVAAIGTGVAVLRRDDDATVRQVDGWGFPVGDEGGGAWLGLRGMRRLLRERDGRAPASALGRTLGDALGAPDDDGLRAWLRTADATRYATLAAIVAETARGGDAVAEALVAAAAARIADAVAALDAPSPAPAVALVGGLAGVLAPRLPERLRSRLVRAAGGQLDGAARLLGQPLDGAYR